MNAPFQVAQLTTGQSSAAQPKVISLTKPAEGQSVTVKIDGAVKLDFTAISSEKITLVHGIAPVAERLTILFDNKSVVIVEPFFDSSGKPLHIVSGIELEPGRVVSAEEFAQIFPMTDNQDVLAGAGNAGAPAKSSGGEFAGPTVDGLPDFVRLPLLGPEELGNWTSDIPRNPDQGIQQAATPPAPPLLAPDDNDVTVEEAAMDKFTTAPDLTHGTVTGSLPGSAAETDASNQLNGSGGVGTLTYQLVTGGNNPTAGTYGTIQVNPDGSYVYTLTSPFHSSSDANDGHNVEGAESFTYQVTDSDGHTATGTITVNIVDDVPTATADTGDVNEGALLTVDAASGVLSNDEQGADGATILGVRAAGGDTTSEVTGGVGNSIVGLHGTLILAADGSYTYQSDANDITSDTTDVFVYTLKDGDGDLSTTTLTINLTNGTVLAPDDSDVTVYESALDTTTTGDDLAHGTITGSLGTGSAAETDSSNQLNGSGGFGTLTYELVTGGNNPTAGTYGTIQVNSNGTYTYTLTSPFDTSPDNDNGNNTEVAESFTYKVTDENGNTQTGTITVNIVDDVPTATADTGDVNEGALLTVDAASGVLSNDEKGADGATILGVRAAGGDTTTDVSGGVGLSIVGDHGTLILAADGSYTYQSDANDITADTTDVFVYTLKDGDGDLSTTTLTINLTDATILAPEDKDVTVYESALDTTTTGDDLAHGTVTGSLGTGSAAETDATNQLNGSGGFGTLTYELVTGGNNPTAGTYGTIQLNSDGSYVYTLTSPFDTSPDNNNGNNTEVAESFTYKVTDENGNTQTGTIKVNIVDDVPTATADTGNVTEGGLLQVAASGVLVNDKMGADGASIVGVRAAAGDNTTAASGDVGTAIAGDHGTLTLYADGHYTYQSTANDITSDTTDVFVYTLKDGDGDLSTTTLTINLADVTILAPEDKDVTVYESALDTTTTGSDLAHGTVTGSLGTSSALETDASNQLNGSGGVGTLTYELVTGGNDPTAGTYGTIQVNSNGSYVYTLTSPFDTTPDNNNGNTTEVAESFTYKVTDENGNTQTGTIKVNIVDDVPTAMANTGNVNEGALLTVNAVNGVLANDVAGADGYAAGGGVVGVRAAGLDTTTAVTTGVNTSIAGLHGTLTLQADGSYTYQSTANNISSNTTDVFVYTIKDGDGDLSTTTLTINLTDSGLLAPNDNDVTVYESALDTTTTGSDLAHGTITGSLGTASALETDASNQLNGSGGFGTLTYSLVSGGNAATTGTYGTIQVNSDGSYVYTLTSPFDTTPDANNGNNTEVAESFTYKVTDGNGNTATGTITVNIVDDVPSTVVTDYAVVQNGNTAPLTLDLDIDDTVINNYGADTAGTVRFPASLETTSSGLTSNGVPIVYDVSADGLTLTATAGANTIFTVVLDPANGHYTIDMNGTVDATTKVDFSSGTYSFVGGNNEWAGFIGMGETVAVPIDNNSADLLLTPAINGLPDSSINTSANSGGVGSGGSVGPTETFRVDFVTDLRGDPASTGAGDYDTLSKRDHVFDGHYTTNGSTATFTATSGSTVKITAFDDPDGNNVVGDGVKDTLTGVVISYNNATLLIDLTAPLQPSYTIGGHVFTVTENADGSINVGGVFADNAAGTQTQIGIFTADGYNSVEYTWAAGDTFKIGNFGAAVPTTNPTNFTIPIEVVDGDGDTVASSIGVTVGAAAVQDHSNDLVGDSHTYTATVGSPHVIGSDFADTINGTNANNILSGGPGDDIFIGGGGSDTLIGGAGADHFRYTATTDGGTISNQAGADHILDFSIAAGDVIEISAAAFGGGLVAGTDATGKFGSSANDTFGSATERFHYNTTSHTLLYDSNGSTAGGTQVALAVLENGGTIDAAHIKIV